MNKKPLEGIRVIELATMIAVPSCGRLLSQLGAEVIKIETLGGAPYRKFGYMTGNETVMFDMLNMQKKSVSVNAKTKEGRELVYKLLETADVFLTNVRTKSLVGLGLSSEDVHKINEKIIFAHFSGYGEKGDLKDLPGYDSTSFFTRFGLLHEYSDPDFPPTALVPGFGDIPSGICLAMNIIAALFSRERHGNGERIETALCQVASWMSIMPMIYAQYGVTYTIKNGHPPVDITNSNMRCSDGEYVFIACGTVQQDQNLLRAVGLEDLVGDERFSTPNGFYENTPFLYEKMMPIFLTKPAEEWVKILRSFDVPCERHRHTIEISTDQQLLENGFTYRTNYGDKTITVPNPPINFETVDFTTDERGPMQGQHTKELMKSLGYSNEEISDMMDKNIIIAK